MIVNQITKRLFPLNKIVTNQCKAFSKTKELPTFISKEENSIDILHSESNDILFNLATEEYMFERLHIINPLLFLWRNSKTIIIGKH